MSDTLRFKPSDLTINDLVDFEQVTGKDLFEMLPDSDEAAENFSPSMSDMRALIWIVRRQETPGLTLEQAGDIKITQLDIDVREDGDGEGGPTSGAGSKS